MSIHERRINEGTKAKIIDRIESAQMNGYRYIELLHNEIGDTDVEIIGIEDVKFDGSGREKKIDNAQLIFTPDVKNKRWGYILDTKRNIDFLAKMLKTNMFSIVSIDDKNIVVNYAIKNNISITQSKRQSIDDMISAKSKEDELKDRLANQEAVINFLKKQAGITDENISEALAPKEEIIQDEPEVKPLKGVKINKDKMNKE